MKSEQRRECDKITNKRTKIESLLRYTYSSTLCNIYSLKIDVMQGILK